MLAAAGLEHNRSRFIVKRLFAERFEVIRHDPSKVEFLTRLNDLYFQFQRVGNNYNQVPGHQQPLLQRLDSPPDCRIGTAYP